MNTRSRLGELAYQRALELLRDLQVPIEARYPIQNPSRLHAAVESALAAGHDLIIVGGGDGSISSAVDAIAHRHAVLGVLPLGTGNDFARTLEIPLDLEGACETIARGKVVDVDLGLAGDNYYVNMASVGLGAQVAKAVSPTLKRRAGGLAYPIATVISFFRYRPFSASIIFPKGDHAPARFDRLLQVAVANGRFYGGGMVVAPDSGIDDRSLDVYAIELGKHRDLLDLVRYFRSGEFVKNDCVSHWRTQRVRLETDWPLPMNVDGELAGHTPEEFSLAPNALRVIVPRGSTIARYDAVE